MLKNKIIPILIITALLISSLCSCDTLDSFDYDSDVSYDLICSTMLFHHIQCVGVDYYLLDEDEHPIPDDVIPFAEERCRVTLVDQGCEPYDSERTEEGRLYQNDADLDIICF